MRTAPRSNISLGGVSRNHHRHHHVGALAIKAKATSAVKPGNFTGKAVDKAQESQQAA